MSKDECNENLHHTSGKAKSMEEIKAREVAEKFFDYDNEFGEPILLSSMAKLILAYGNQRAIEELEKVADEMDQSKGTWGSLAACDLYRRAKELRGEK